MIAEVTFTIPAGDLQLGQWANVYVQIADVKDGLLIPGGALTAMESQAFVFVVDQQDVIHRKPVTVIARSPRSADIAITGHVSAGDRIVLAPMGRTTAEKIRPNPVSAKAVAMAP